ERHRPLRLGLLDAVLANDGQPGGDPGADAVRHDRLGDSDKLDVSGIAAGTRGRVRDARKDGLAREGDRLAVSRIDHVRARLERAWSPPAAEERRNLEVLGVVGRLLHRDRLADRARGAVAAVAVTVLDAGSRGIRHADVGELVALPLELLEEVPR